MRRRFYAFGHPGAQHGLIRYAGINTLEPIVPPPKHLLQKTDLRAGKRKARIPMCPRPDEALARHRQSLEQAWNCILIAIGPAADGIHRALDRLIILAHRPMLPIRIASLVLQPTFKKQRHVLQALQPHRPPAIAYKYWIGRKAHRAEKERGPFKTSRKKCAAHVVGVIGVPIVGRTNRYNRFECRRAARRNLKSIE